MCATIDKENRILQGFHFHDGALCFPVPGFQSVDGWQDYLTMCVILAQSREMDKEIEKMDRKRGPIRPKNIDN